jgi:hypothetical protein
VIRKQNNVINKLVGHIRTLEAFIRQQATVIERLVARVRYLTAQVNYWRGQAQYWYGRAMYWRDQAAYWYGKAMYYRRVAMQLVDLAYVPQFRGHVKASIDAGRGLPNLWLGTYAAQFIGVVGEELGEGVKGLWRCLRAVSM